MRLPTITAAATRAATAHLAAATLSSLLCFAPLQLQPALPFLSTPAALADGDTAKFKFPPIDRSNKDRCKFVSSAMGQANAARDSLYDLRECSMSNAKAGGFDLSGALMASGDFSKADFKEAQLSKARLLHNSRCFSLVSLPRDSSLRVYAEKANFDGADFTNGVIDRAFFKGASFKGALFNNAVLSSSSFDEANLQDADFTEAYIGSFDQRKLCKNPTLKGENPTTGAPTRESAGCPDP